ncbi:cell wall synthesis protein KRE9/KNH1-domain-containing protein, partial [Pyronema omphalodes]
GTTVQIDWKDDGSEPSLDKFTTFSVWLCMGSNAVPLCDTILGPSGAAFSPASTTTKFLIPDTVGGNGDVYFLKMETVSPAGGMAVNFSPRFAMSGMKGTFSAAALAEQKKGDVAPPPGTDTTTPAAGAPAAGDPAAMAKVPYSMQTGPTRYAPMQTQPGTKITAKSASRAYPTSSYSVFKSKGPKPIPVTTQTLSWDYKVTSLVNTAAPAPTPTKGSKADLQRVLRRWKD